MSRFETLCTYRPAHNRHWGWTRKVTDHALKLFDQRGDDDKALKWMQEYCDWLERAERIVPADETAQNEFQGCVKFAADKLRSGGRESQGMDLIKRLGKKDVIEAMATEK